MSTMRGQEEVTPGAAGPEEVVGPEGPGESAQHAMTPGDVLTRAGDQLSIRRVFGDPVERDGVTVIPVAVAIGGGGGGIGPDDQGSGGGFGGMVRGIGVYSIADGQVRFIPAIDATALAALAMLVVRTVLRASRRRSRRR